MENVVKSFFGNSKVGKIYTYPEFLSMSEEKLRNTDPDTLDEKGKIYFGYSQINLHRTRRIDKSFKPNDNIVELIKEIDEPQTWLVITEDWCGDSAQNIPYIEKYLSFNKKINLVLILRDSNLEAIDGYFKEGNPRSIPKILGFDKDGKELFVWGPRPKFAQDLVTQLKAEGYTSEEFNKELHLWYGRNRGKELEKELEQLLLSLRRSKK